MTLLADLVATSAEVGGTSSRRAKTDVLARLLRKLDPDEIAIAVAYLSGELPQGRIGLGYATLRDARSPGSSEAATLTLAEVDAAFSALGATAGPGSAASRVLQLRALFVRATPPEQEFLVRLVVGELRQGALEGLMIEAVAAATNMPAASVRRAAMLGGGVVRVARTALTEGEGGLSGYRMQMFQPVAPMLAQPAEDIASALQALPTAAVELKMDGARVQVHKRGEQVRLYTRSLNDVTDAAPEIVAAVRALPATELIADGEVIALKQDGTPCPFQVTMSRFGRSLDIAAQREALPLSVFFFDCLLHDGRDVVAMDAAARYEELARAVAAPLLMPRLVPADAAAAQAFYDDAIARGHEGVMVKALVGPYEPGARSSAWLKVKRAHTLDLVVLAAEWGHGRRHGWLSNLHLGARDPATGSFVMLGKTFKGLTDAILEWQTRELLARATDRGDHVVHVRPELVVEITFNDLQASPRYPAGLALRFARVKGYRPDKQARDADTIETVRAIFAAQSQA